MKLGAATSTWVGNVKSWNGSKGFGFIISPAVQGDVMFSRNELPEDCREVRGKFLDGKTVHFQLGDSSDGRAKASSVVVVAKPGEQVAGRIKSYSSIHGYGFVCSSAVDEDYRFELKDLSPGVAEDQLKGKLVCFTPFAMPDGKKRARGIMFQSQKIATEVSASTGGITAPKLALSTTAGLVNINDVVRLLAGAGVPIAGIASLLGTPVAGATSVVQGVVKSYSEKNGYGFIRSPSSPVDIKFGASDLQGMTTVKTGTPVSFVLQGTQAKEVTMSQGGVKRQPIEALIHVQPPSKKLASSPSPFEASSTGQWLSGSVKTYNATKGFGFISSPGFADIFFMKTNLPVEVQSVPGIAGLHLTFELQATPDGKLRADNISVA